MLRRRQRRMVRERGRCHHRVALTKACGACEAERPRYVAIDEHLSKELAEPWGHHAAADMWAARAELELEQPRPRRRRRAA